MMHNIWVIPDWELALRLFVAAVLGGVVGWERERHNHAAGFRTHILVSLGSALIMLISIYGFSDFVRDPNVRVDPGRIAAQVVSGIGFLGAGTILRQGFSITGLTTAASLWVVAGIGLAVGTGFIFAAVLTTGLVLVSLQLLNRLEHIMMKKRRLYVIHMVVQDEPGKLGELTSVIGESGGNIRKVSIDEGEDGSRWMGITLTVGLLGKSTLPELCDEIRKVKGVKTVRTE